MNEACWANLVQTHQAAFQDPEAGPGVVLLAVPLLGLVLAVLMAPLWQAWYSSRIKRFMGLRELATPPGAWWRRRERLLGRRDAGRVDAGPAMPLAEALRLRERRVRRATGLAYGVCVLYSLMLAPWMLDMNGVDHALMLVFVAVLAAGPAMVNVVPEGSKRGLFVGGLLATALALWAEGDVDWDDVLVGGVIIGMLYIASVHRTMRALVVPLLVLSAAAVLGLAAAVWLLLPLNCLVEGADQADASSWLLMAVVVALPLLAFVVFMWLGTRALDGLLAIVQRGWLSDRSVVAFAGLALLAGVLMLALDDPEATPVLRVALYLGWMGSTAAAYAWMLHRQPCPRVGRRLLMLRVFSHDRRAERLLDAVQSRWQWAGPVMEIAGPDLATLNLDLTEFIPLVTFRLQDLFQPSAGREQLASSLDLALDHEGRFRVNEVFCFDTSWRVMVEQLMSLSDVIVLDLRGFQPQRQGTAHEVRRLAALGLLPRVVALSDASTDWACFDACVAEAGPKPGLALRIDAADPQALADCMNRLLQIADTPAAR